MTEAPERMAPDCRELVQALAQAVRAVAPIEPKLLADAAFAVMCKALSEMEPEDRDPLIASLGDAAADRVAGLLRGRVGKTLN